MEPEREEEGEGQCLMMVMFKDRVAVGDFPFRGSGCQRDSCFELR